MDNKILFSQWAVDKWRYVKIYRFHAPFTRSMAGAELIYTLPFTLDEEDVKQIDDFVLNSLRSYDPQTSMHDVVISCDEQRDILIRNYSHYKKTTFVVYNNPDSSDVHRSIEQGHTSWWSYRASFNIYVNPYIDEIDFEIYKNSGTFMTYKLDKEAETEELMHLIWDNAKTLEELQ